MTHKGKNIARSNMFLPDRNVAVAVDGKAERTQGLDRKIPGAAKQQIGHDGIVSSSLPIKMASSEHTTHSRRLTDDYHLWPIFSVLLLYNTLNIHRTSQWSTYPVMM